MLPDLVSRENGAKSQSVGDHFGIGAAADALGLGGLPGIVAVDPQQRPDQRAVRRHIDAGLVELVRPDKAAPGHGLFHLGSAFFKGAGHRIPVVEPDLKCFTVKGHHAQIKSQLAGQGVLHSDAQRGAVPFHADAGRQRVYRLLQTALQRQPVQKQQQPADGVFSLPGRAAVGVNPGRLDPNTAVNRGDRHLFGGHGGNLGRQCGRTGQHRRGVIGHDIVRRAAR